MIRFGPAGIGGVKEIPKVLEMYKDSEIRAAEIPFTYQIWIKTKEQADIIRKAAEKYRVRLSVHAQYWINLNSESKETVENSKKRILGCCKVASWLKAKKVVFHCGFYGKREKEETYQNIKAGIIEMRQEIKKNKWDVELCPEVMGKKNVFGSIQEIARLAKETKCGFCIDFAHVLARYGRYDIAQLKKYFPQKKWHGHFSGIEYGAKGEKHHKITEEKEIKRLLSVLPQNKDITIVNESPDPIGDTILSIKIYNEH